MVFKSRFAKKMQISNCPVLPIAKDDFTSRASKNNPTKVALRQELEAGASLRKKGKEAKKMDEK